MFSITKFVAQLQYLFANFLNQKVKQNVSALACMLTLSPEKLPSPTKEFGKCLKVGNRDVHNDNLMAIGWHWKWHSWMSEGENTLRLRKWGRYTLSDGNTTLEWCWYSSSYLKVLVFTTPFKACKQLLVAEDSQDDHPDIRWLLNDPSIYDLHYDL